MSLILVRQREEQPQEMEQPQDQEQQQQQGEEGDEEQINFQIVSINQAEVDEEYVGNNIEDDERIEILREIFTEEDQDLEAEFINQLENLTHSSLIQIDPREKLPKAKLDNQLKESAKRILSVYLKEVDTIPEICDKVYAMGRAIGIKLGKLVEVNHGNRKKRFMNGDNRREPKLKKEIKQLRQVVAKASNELYRRRTRRKATKKETKIIKELKALIGKETTSYNLRNAREQWLDTLRYKNIKFSKCEEKRRRKQDNVMFQRDQRGFFRTLEGNVVHEGEMPEMEKFVEFCGGIWEREEVTPNMPWMEVVR